jgi:hypothetical protein
MKEKKTSRRRVKKAAKNGLWGLLVGATMVGAAADSVPDDLMALTLVLATVWISFCAGVGFWYGWTGRSVMVWLGLATPDSPRPRRRPRRPAGPDRTGGSDKAIDSEANASTSSPVGIFPQHPDENRP